MVVHLDTDLDLGTEKLRRLPECGCPSLRMKQSDNLFFFTDTISHGAYNKFLKVVRTHEIPFGYLHGTNIPETVRQVFETMKEKP